MDERSASCTSEMVREQLGGNILGDSSSLRYEKMCRQCNIQSISIINLTRCLVRKTAVCAGREFDAMVENSVIRGNPAEAGRKFEAALTVQV
jgi:hypothetical protein